MWAPAAGNSDIDHHIRSYYTFIHTVRHNHDTWRAVCTSNNISVPLFNWVFVGKKHQTNLPPVNGNKAGQWIDRPTSIHCTENAVQLKERARKINSLFVAAVKRPTQQQNREDVYRLPTNQTTPSTAVERLTSSSNDQPTQTATKRKTTGEPPGKSQASPSRTPLTF